MFAVLFVIVLLPFLSFALPSSHTRSFLRHRSIPTLRSSSRVIAYYPDWAPPNSIDYSLFDIIIFAFALPDQDYQLQWDTDQAPTLLANIIPAAHAKGTKVMVSVGGWTGSRWFSNAVATARNRAIFANSILDIYKRFYIDGIDIDWEYPGQAAQQGNTESATDASNMLQFFKVLRQVLPPDALISAAVQDSTFVGRDGQPMKDLSDFSQVIDWVTLMNYDTFQTRQPPGPNAPLSDACGNSSQPSQNAVGGYNAWTSAGFPPSKIILGVPSYGYITQSGATTLSARSSRARPEDGTGQIQFQSLVNQGILVQEPNESFRAAESSGFTRGWDQCSATPYLHSNSAQQVISYDDPESLRVKVAWAKRMNMGGVNLFDVHGDTPQHHLARALRDSLFTQPTAPSNTVPSSNTISSDMISPSTSMAPSSSIAGSVLPSSSLSSSGLALPSVTLPGGAVVV